MLTCKQVSETATDYLEGPNRFWQSLSFRFHLLMCVNCRRYINQLRLTVLTVQQSFKQDPLPTEPTDEDVETLVQKLKRAGF